MKKFTCLLFLLGIFYQNLEAQTYQRHPSSRYLKIGDDSSWKAVDYDHQGWGLWTNTSEKGVFWLRFEMVTDSITDRFEQAGLQIISMGAYECYWDGELIGSSGQVGRNQAEEIPGRLISQIRVPDSLMEHGTHLIAFRVSNFYKGARESDNWNVCYLEEYMTTRFKDLSRTAWMFILAGVYLMAAIYYLLLYLLRKRTIVNLIFSLLCFLFLSLILAEYSKFIFQYDYPFHVVRLMIIYGLTLTIAFLMPVFFLLYFQTPLRKVWIPLILLSYGILTLFHAPGLDSGNQILATLMWYYSMAICAFAAFKQKTESWIMLVALLLAGVVIYFNDVAYYLSIFAYDINLFVSFSILVLAMMYLLAVRARNQQRAYESSLVLSARLQNELLKKNIQPHFIMNTLTSLMEWVEESPKESVAFIEALAGEFEIMSEIAEQKLIPIKQEFDLIEKHISIMQYRKEINYVFTWKNIDFNEQVPPAIFHTLIENGITHSLPDENNQIKMELSYQQHAGAKIYTLKTMAKNRSRKKYMIGTGTKYIQSRLKENYGDQWKFESSPSDFGWKSTITIGHSE